MRRLLLAGLIALAPFVFPPAASAQTCSSLDLGGGVISTHCSGPGLGSSMRTDTDLGGGMTGSVITGTTEWGAPYSGTGSSIRSRGAGFGAYSCYDINMLPVPCR